MFFKSKNVNDIKKENNTKIGLLYNGVSAGIFKNAFKLPSFVLVPLPYKKSEKKDFEKKYCDCRDENGTINISVFELEDLTCDIDDYVLIHKNDYEKFLAFQHSKKINADKIELIKKRYFELKSQRAVAKEFNISPATVNKILNDSY